MIERESVEGRDAMVAYLTSNLAPSSKENAELIKIVFDDGDIRFALPVKNAPS